MTQSIPHIMPGGEPFFFRGNAVGILCIHGFMASPAEIRWLGKHLADQGYTVYGPRLPGHATDYHDISRYRWQDWYAAVEDSLNVLRAQCDRVFVVGHSMGGMLGLLLAANTQIDGLAALATPVLFNNRSMANTRWIKWIRPYTDQSDRSTFNQVVRDEQARRGEDVIGRVRYDLWSTAAVGELFALSLAVQDCLAKVQSPLLLMYSEGDKTVGLTNRDYLLAHLKTSDVEQHTLKQSDHILPQDSERETVFEQVADFIKRKSNPGA
ncbi:MAG: alpha/beta fold hydrolase [Anaerolineaceae bacterium]|nr:alpha/beta fold hydrolase [Anaerolineaceae bacterium]